MKQRGEEGEGVVVREGSGVMGQLEFLIVVVEGTKDVTGEMTGNTATMRVRM